MYWFEPALGQPNKAHRSVVIIGLERGDELEGNPLPQLSSRRTINTSCEGRGKAQC